MTVYLYLAKREFREYYDDNIAILREAENSFRTQVLSLLADQPSFTTPHVVSRIKEKEECIGKFQGTSAKRVADVIENEIAKHAFIELRICPINSSRSAATLFA